MIVDTGHLFSRLLRTFQIDTVCDVGSMDGSDALRVRRALPAAEVIALEPNPRNFELMSMNGALADQRIRALPLAAQSGMTVWIRNTFKPQARGTRIGAQANGGAA